MSEKNSEINDHLLWCGLEYFWPLAIVVTCCLWLVLNPVVHALEQMPKRRHFYLLDFFWLLLMLQPSLMLLAGASVGHNDMFFLMGLISLPISAYAWWYGVVVLSTLGIEYPIRRGLFLVLLLPVALWLPFLALWMLFFNTQHFGLSTIVYVISVMVMFIFLIYGSHGLCRWVTRGASKAVDGLRRTGANEKSVVNSVPKAGE